LNAAGIVKHGLQFLLRGGGALASAAGHALLFTRLDPNSRWPEVEGLFAPYGLVGANAGDTSQEQLESAGEHDVTQMELLSRPSVTVITALLHPRSRGRIELRSADPRDHPVIRHRLMTDEDLADLASACQMMRVVASAEPLLSKLSAEALPGSIVQRPEDWEAYLRQAAWGAQHPVGSCRMGSEPTSVVDPRLRVRGVEGLRVVDASVMPTLTSGNTNAPTIMIAEKAATLIVG
jgi:choline dehydrogenase